MKWTEFEKKKLVKTFSIKYYSLVYEQEFSGDFSCKKQSVGDSIRVEVEKSRLTDGHIYDSTTGKGITREADFFITAVAVCKVCIVKAPEWFDLEELETCKDQVLIIRVAQEVLKYEDSFRASDNPRPAVEYPTGAEEVKDGAGSSQGNSSLPRKGKDALVTPKKVVDDEVPSISKI